MELVFSFSFNLTIRDIDLSNNKRLLNQNEIGDHKTVI